MAAAPALETSLTQTKVANIFFNQYKCSTSENRSKPQHLLLLHGWMGCADDFHQLAQQLAQSGYVVLVPDLPFHSRSIKARPASITAAAQIIARALPRIIPSYARPHPIALMGYSMGGRLALEFATLVSNALKPLFTVAGMILLSCAPSPDVDVENEYDLCAAVSLRLSADVRSLDSDKKSFERWLRTQWYSSSMWGRIRMAPAFEALIADRVDRYEEEQRDAWADATVSMGRATMTQPTIPFHIPTLYICGRSDKQYIFHSESLERLFTNWLCLQVPDVGHNIALQRPDIVQSCAVDFFDSNFPIGGLRSITIDSLRTLPYSLPLKNEIVVNGTTVSKRQGILVVILSVDGYRGVGDICPLPGLHQQNVSDCLAELYALFQLQQLRNPQIEVTKLSDLDACFSQLSKVTRNGIESAIIHLLSRMRGETICSLLQGLDEDTGSSLRDDVSMNAVLPRTSVSENDMFTQFVRDSAFDTLKLKVGASDNVEDEAILTKNAVMVAQNLGKQIRLDANRAWNTDKFHAFEKGLGDCVNHVEFIEEPLETTMLLAEHLQRHRDGDSNLLPIALDESLSELTSKQLQQMASSPLCKALVVKPSIIGSLSDIATISLIGRQTENEVIMSTCFESGVGTAWTALLANAFGTNSPHGLGTFKYLETDVVQPSFEEHVSGVTIEMKKCESFLDMAAAHVFRNGKELDY